ncbi:Abi family protein [Adlercreutzia sp. ZJ304]|uniref:Abi family protein n=1 Tax=Adlercreutzia sp. ZJ304 TaxID=2709791 RepID=UPI0013E9AF61|nr:Abi family protein [Adlercreutzia sp. ZJ304]
MEYAKPYLNHEEQADKLVGMGMGGSKADILGRLEQVGYYRLSGYWHDYRQLDGKGFRVGITIDTVWSDYVFDRQFRLAVLDAVERVEIYTRARLAHKLARDTGAFGFDIHEGLPRLSENDYKKFIDKCRSKHRSSREPFEVHFRNKYGDAHDIPPYWILVNTMDFGQMLTLYRGASVEIRNELSSELSVSARVFESWLVALNVVRNICAHHGRLWNKELGVKPVIPKHDIRWHKPYEVQPYRMFSILTILGYLLDYVAPSTSWHTRLIDLLDRRSADKLYRMGFSEGWQECPFWKPYVMDFDDGDGRANESTASAE